MILHERTEYSEVVLRKSKEKKERFKETGGGNPALRREFDRRSIEVGDRKGRVRGSFNEDKMGGMESEIITMN